MRRREMKKIIPVLLLLLLAGIYVAYAVNKNNEKRDNETYPQLGKDSIDEVISAMTLEEKVRFVVGTAKMHPNPPYPAPGTFMRPPAPENNEVVTFSTETKVKGAAGESFPVTRLRIPSIVYADGPAGVRIDPTREGSVEQYYATAFPIATLLASSWDVNLVKQVGEAMGKEVLEYGVDILLAPGMNIHRNPLTGRNFEYYSEDPLLSGKMAAALVNGIQSNGVGTSIKHFAANNQETYRNGINVKVSERCLREIYLKGFEIALKESSPWTVMSSYNKINGEYASESHDLLTKLLRDEWGYSGFVLTDWWAEHDPVEQMKAGNDLLMPGTEEQIQAIISAVNEGKLDEEIINRNVKNILQGIIKMPAFRNYAYSNKPDLTNHAELVRASAAESMILLENKNDALPISEQKKIALFGVASYDIIVGGSGSGYVYKSHKISLEEGLNKAGYQTDETLSHLYKTYIEQQKKILPAENFWHVPVVSETMIENEEIERLALDSDIAILTIGRNSGEGDDRKLEKGDYYLTDIERSLIEEVVAAFKKQEKETIVVLNIGGVIEMTDWKNLPDAILLAWQPGQEGGYAIADVLTGKVNPSGKLPMTFPKQYADVPSAGNFPWSDNDPSVVKYVEDIFVGYRYYNTYHVNPLYEFGYGLSYTQFKYSDLTFTESDDDILISVTVKNNGKTPGKEVVQLYVTPPNGSLKKPAEELKAFGKTTLLQPDESQTLSFLLKPEDLASYHEEHAAWITDTGIYTIKIGSSSKEIRLSKNNIRKNEWKKAVKNLF